MANSKLVSEVVFGGTAVNNPVPFSIDNFNLSALQLTFVYQQRNVIAFHNRLQVNMQVTALVQVDTFVKRIKKIERSD